MLQWGGANPRRRIRTNVNLMNSLFVFIVFNKYNVNNFNMLIRESSANLCRFRHKSYNKNFQKNFNSYALLRFPPFHRQFYFVLWKYLFTFVCP